MINCSKGAFSFNSIHNCHTKPHKHVSNDQYHCTLPTEYCSVNF